MAGKLCSGSAMNNAGAARISQSKAYCEAITYRASGTSVSKPKTGNPHADTTSPDHVAWDAGWDAAEASEGSALASGCCAKTGVISA